MTDGTAPTRLSSEDEAALRRAYRELNERMRTNPTPQYLAAKAGFERAYRRAEEIVAGTRDPLSDRVYD